MVRMNKNIATLYLVLIITLVTSIVIYYKFNQHQKEPIENTFASPEEANAEIQKILGGVSTHVNRGIISVQHLEELDKAKSKIFKK